MSRPDPNYNPHRLKCPGCGFVGKPRLSPLDLPVLRKLGITSFMCRKCARHVWAKKPRNKLASKASTRSAPKDSRGRA